MNNIKKEMRVLLDHIQSGYAKNTTKQKLTEDRQIVREEADFTDALRQKVVQEDDFKNGEVHQAIMNVAYKDWQNSDQINGYAEMVEHAYQTYGPLAAFAVLAGKHNQQVENGGHAQYFDNGYAGGEGPGGRKTEQDTELHHMLIELAEKYNIASLPNGAEALKIYNEWEPSLSDCHECDGQGYFDEECPDCQGSGQDEEGNNCEQCDGQGTEEGECSQCGGTGEGDMTGEADYLDRAWYKINGPYMEALNNFFASKLKVQESIEHVEETATAGGSSAGGVATVVGGLGAGFDDDMSKSIYGKKKGKKKESTIIRRR